MGSDFQILIPMEFGKLNVGQDYKYDIIHTWHGGSLGHVQSSAIK